VVTARPPARHPRRAGEPHAPRSEPSVRVACAGCGVEADPDAAFPARCAAAQPGDDIDHVMTRRLDLRRVRFVAGDDPNPFVRYRQLFRAWHVARQVGWSDQRYVDLVRRLDDAVAAVDGHGFRVTPFGREPGLSAKLGFREAGGVWVKDETGGVGGSHKARHLMGVLLELLVAETREPALAARPLAIASCGNAALAAAIVARAAGRHLDVYVPPDADPAVLDRLAGLGAVIERVPRRPGVTGDPTVARLRSVVAAGAIPFSCQGPENGLAIEGGQTLGYEIAEAAGGRDLAGRDPATPAAGRIDRIVVQVGGGALASAVAHGLAEATAIGELPAVPRLDTVQTAGGWPLRRAYEHVAEQLRLHGLDPCHALDPDLGAARTVLDDVARHRSRAMWPWVPEPRSVAHGILDDETYDWLAVTRAMLATGGCPLVVDEPTLRGAATLAATTTGIPADETGAAGLAGVLELRRRGELKAGEQVVILLTGARRHDTPANDGADASPRHPSSPEETT
jgi:threonine synthase